MDSLGRPSHPPFPDAFDADGDGEVLGLGAHAVGLPEEAEELIPADVVRVQAERERVLESTRQRIRRAWTEEHEVGNGSASARRWFDADARACGGFALGVEQLDAH